MQEGSRNYWAMRFDTQNRKLLYEELEKGKLRQGWGYSPELNLRLIKEKIKRGEPLTPEQKNVWRWQRRMLTDEKDGIKKGDIIIIPNMPGDGMFMIVEVTGDYEYDPLQLEESQRVSGFEQDYAHVLPVKILTPEGVNKYAGPVSANIRRTLRAQNRLWNIYHLKDDVENLLHAYQERRDELLKSLTTSERIYSAIDKLYQEIYDSFRDNILEELNKKIHAAEWEEAIAEALQNLYPGAEVERTGGPYEHGMDIVVRIPNYFYTEEQDTGSTPYWTIGVQVKNHQGTTSAPEVLRQIEDALEYAQTALAEDKLIHLVIITTADQASEDLLEGAGVLAQRSGVPITILTKKKLAELLAKSFIQSYLPELST